MQSAKGLRTLFNTLIISLPAIFNVGSLLFLLMFVYGVLGMNLFGEVAIGQQVTHASFSNFGMSLLTLFRVFTGDAWSSIMAAESGCNYFSNDCSSGKVRHSTSDQNQEQGTRLDQTHWMSRALLRSMLLL